MSFTLENVSIYDTRRRRFVCGAMSVSEGLISEAPRTEASDRKAALGGFDGCFVIPGMIDVHTHGRAGGNFASASAEGLALLRESYAASGTTSVFATIDTVPFEEMVGAVEGAARSAAEDTSGCSIDGIHLEGRYLNPARRGAHNPALLAPPDTAELERLLGAAGGLPARVSFAPELEGGREFLARALALGATAGIGHSDCTYEGALDALSAGASFFTHTYNAMSPFTHRSPGAVGAALLSDAYTELICDGFHLHPAAVKLASRLKSPDKIILITDSMPAAGKGDGVYGLAGMTVTVKNGRAINSEGAIAGSTLDLLDGLFNYCSFTGTPLEDAIPLATENPARQAGIYGFTGSLETGKRADFCVLAPDRRTLIAVCCRGKLNVLNKNGRTVQ